MSDKKKYPGIKKIFFRRRSEQKNIEGVYAGPANFGGGPSAVNGPADENGGGTEAVYEGPEYFGAVREEPSDGYDGEIEEVYAGPVYFGGVTEEPEVTEEDDGQPAAEGSRAGEGTFTRVYAGPSVPRGEFKVVYAGPEYFSATGKAPAGDGGERRAEGPGECGPAKRICRVCGAENADDAGFCRECGAELKDGRQ